MYLKKKLCVCVVVYYLDKQFSNFAIKYLRENKNVRETGVHIGPRSNILSKTNNGPNSCDIVLCSNHLSFIANSDIYAVQFPLFCIQLTRICYTLLAKAVSNIVLHKNSEELSITNNDQLLQCTLYTYIDSTGMIIFYC